MDTFVDALALNWLIGGTDAHAKNYSFLIGAEGTIRLAPLYDVASALPYPSMPEQKLKLAMKIGGKYRLRDIGLYEWEKLAAELSLDADSVVQRVANLALRVPDLASTLHAREKQAGLTHPVVDRLVAALCQRAKKCATAMYAGARRRR
jgi:serine/threonine-protein kinase HipA